MLNTLQIRQFTVFQNVTFEFSPSLNVIVGDNGTGKTYVLNLAIRSAALGQTLQQGAIE